MKKIAILTVLLFNLCFAAAQTGEKISGNIFNAAGNPVDGAILSLVTANESVKVTSVITDHRGHWVIKPVSVGNYRYWVTHINYQKYDGGIISINHPTDTVFLGKTILMAGQVRQLKEVAVTGRRPFTEHN